MLRYLLPILFVIAGFLAYRRFKPKPPLPPPPPPIEKTALLLQPSSVVNAEEETKIVKAAYDPDPTVRWEALVLLDKIKSPKANPLVLELVHTDPDAEIRVKLVEVLSNRRGPEIMDALVGCLKDLEPMVRVAALKALDKIGDYNIAAAVTEAVRDPDETVRVQALKTLNSLQDRKAADIVSEQKRLDEAQRQQNEEYRKRLKR